MLGRFKDKVPEIRSQAVTALQRLQDPKDDECPIIKVHSVPVLNIKGLRGFSAFVYLLFVFGSKVFNRKDCSFFCHSFNCKKFIPL